MATDDSFVEYVWLRLGADCREHVRHYLDLINRFEFDDRPKVLACFFWANGLRGRKDYVEGREKF